MNDNSDANSKPIEQQQPIKDANKDVGKDVGKDAGKIAGNTVAGPIGGKIGGKIGETLGKAVGKKTAKNGESGLRNNLSNVGRNGQKGQTNNMRQPDNGKGSLKPSDNIRKKAGGSLNPLKKVGGGLNPFNKIKNSGNNSSNNGSENQNTSGSSNGDDNTGANTSENQPDNGGNVGDNGSTQATVKGADSGVDTVEITKKLGKKMIGFLSVPFAGCSLIFLGMAIIILLIIQPIYAAVSWITGLFDGDGDPSIYISTDDMTEVKEDAYYARLLEIYEQYKKDPPQGLAKLFAWISDDYGYGVEIDVSIITATLYASRFLGDTLMEDEVGSMYDDCSNVVEAEEGEEAPEGTCYQDIFSEDFNSREEEFYRLADNDDVAARQLKALLSIEILAKYMIEELPGGTYRINCEKYKEELLKGHFLKAYYPDYVVDQEEVEEMVDLIYQIAMQFGELSDYEGLCISEEATKYQGDQSCKSGIGGSSGSCEYDNMPIRLRYCNQASYDAYNNPVANNSHFPGGYDSSIGAAAETITWDKYIVGVVSREIDPDANEEAIKFQMIMAKAETYYRLSENHSLFDVKNNEVWIPIDADCHQIWRDPDNPPDGRSDISANVSRLYSIYNEISGILFRDVALSDDIPYIIYGNKFQTLFQSWARQGVLYTQMIQMAVENNTILSNEGGGKYSAVVFKNLEYRTCAGAPTSSTSGGMATDIVVPDNANIVKQASSDTLKVSVEKVDRTNRTSYYVTRISVSDATNQLKKATSTWGTLETVKTMLDNEINSSNLSDKIVVGINASGYAGSKEINCDSSMSGTPIGQLVITNGSIIRNNYNSSCTSNHVIYGIDSTSTLRAFVDKTTLSSSERQKLFTEITNSGIKNTFSFLPVLVENGAVTTTSSDGQNIRQAMCQVDNNNFIFITDVYDEARTGFALKELAETMVSLGCKTGVNLDGGGSVNLYIKEASGALTSIVSSSRQLPDVIYFTE
ncbi:MAG: phosphodiester glycosidase family protein [bacterium]|nr:phosphodiester glycosidase family protein [bacterium]